MEPFPKRMFIALPVNAEGVGPVRKELEGYGRNLKVVPGNNYHITLKFLGDTDLARCEKLVSALESLEMPCKVECMIRGLGCFPGLSNPSVIWAGMEYGKGLMEKIFFFAERAAVEAGFQPERRRFSPHLTLARVRRESPVPGTLKDFIKKNSDTVYSACLIDRVVLFESRLQKGGPEYTVYREWQLL